MTMVFLQPLAKTIYSGSMIGYRLPIAVDLFALPMADLKCISDVLK